MNPLIYSIKNLPKPILLLMIVLGLFLLITLAILSSSSPQEELPQEETSPKVIYPQPPSGQASSQQRTYETIKIGETTSEEVKKLPELKGEQVKGNQIEFAFKSGRFNDNTVITENGVVVFKKIVTVDQQTWQHPPLSSYLGAYGKPEAEFTGSNTYGSRFKTYIFPSKGLAFIGNPVPDELYEIQVFEPTTLEQYRSKWGQDINEQLINEQEEGIGG